MVGCLVLAGSVCGGVGRWVLVLGWVVMHIWVVVCRAELCSQPVGALVQDGDVGVCCIVVPRCFPAFLSVRMRHP